MNKNWLEEEWELPVKYNKLNKLIYPFCFYKFHWNMSKEIKKVETWGLGCWPEVNYSTQRAPEMLGYQRYHEAWKVGWGIGPKPGRISKDCEQTMLAPPQPHSVRDTPLPPLAPSLQMEGDSLAKLRLWASGLGDTRHSGGWGETGLQAKWPAPPNSGTPTSFHLPTSGHQSQAHTREKDFSLGKLKDPRQRPLKDDIWESSIQRIGS